MTAAAHILLPELRACDSLKPGGLDAMAAWSVDHTITDPAYDKEAHTQGRRIVSGSFEQRRTTGDTTISKAISYPPMTEAERRIAAQQIARITRRWIIIFCQAEGITPWKNELTLAGAEYIRAGSWHKSDAQPQLSGDRPGQGWEAVVIAHGARAAGGSASDLPLLRGRERQYVGRPRWNGGGHCAIWRGPSRDHGGNLKAKKLLDGQKPIWLITKLIEQFTDPGEIIADPFAGAATMLLCGARLGRRVIGWERTPETVELATQRLIAEGVGVQR